MKRVKLNQVVLAGALAVWAGAASGAENPSWTYLPDAGVLSNSSWTLNVSVRDARRRTLNLGTSGTTGSAFCKKDGAVVGAETLDLSRPIQDAQGRAWTIERIGSSVLNDTASPLRTFIAPRELREIGAHNFDYERSAGLNITFDCPYLEGEKEWNNAWTLPNGFVGGSTSSRLRLSIPNCTKLDSYSLKSLAEPDAGEQWDLGGVRELGGTALCWIPTPESLRLPRLEKMAKGAITGGQTIRKVLSLGDGFDTLAFVGEKAWNPDLSHPIERVFLGCAPGCVFKRYALNSTGLQRVWLTGAVPVFDAAEGEPVFGSRENDGSDTEHAAANSIVFYVPSNRVWRAVCAQATPLTEAETAAFREAHPDWDVPFGVVAPEVFRTKNPQYIGYADEAKLPRYIQVTTFAHRRYGDTWTVKDTVKLSYTVDGVPEEKSIPVGAVAEVPYGAEITLSVQTEDGLSRKAPTPVWEGRLPDGTVPAPGREIRFNATASVSLAVGFPGEWTLARDAEEHDKGTVTDGYWTWPVTIGADGRSLTLAKAADSANAAVKASLAQDGELNLTGPVSDAEGNSWVFSAFVGQTFSGTALTSFYAPRTLTGRSWGQTLNNHSNGKLLVFDCPDYAQDLSRLYDFSSSWSRTILRLPKVTKITGVCGMTFGDTDLADWDLSGLKEVGAGGLAASTSGPGPRGGLDLPNVETLGDRAFANWRRVTSAALGTNGTLKTVGAFLFAGNTNALRKVDFGRSSAFTLNEKAFYTGANEQNMPIALDEIWFSGDAPGTAVLNALVAGRTVSSGTGGVAEDLKIFAPLAKPSWRPVTTPVPRELYAAKKALKQMLDAEGGREYRVVGVYRTKNDGVARAWLVQNPSFAYRNGFELHFR